MKEKKQGLTAIEVEESRAKHGENVLTVGPLCGSCIWRNIKTLWCASCWLLP